jgi:protein-tyrosine phosphatase
MASSIYWITGPIPGRLAVMAKPRAGEWLEDEIAGWKKDGIQFVVSLLDGPEIAELAREEYLCQKFSITFLSHPFAHGGVPPSAPETAALCQTLKTHLQNRKVIAIHSRTAMGRSAVIAACVLKNFGIETKRAFDLVASARGFMVPDTQQQRDWVAEFVGS